MSTCRMLRRAGAMTPRWHTRTVAGWVVRSYHAPRPGETLDFAAMSATICVAGDVFEAVMDQAELLEKAERYLPGACLGMMSLPPDLRMVMVRGQGSKVYDAAGKEYLDYMLGSGPLLLGHGRPGVVEAVQHRAAAGWTSLARKKPAIRQREMIVGAVPGGEAIRLQT